MDNARIFLWIGLAMLAWMNVVQWNRDYGMAPAPAAATAAPAATASPAGGSSTLPSLPTDAAAQPPPAAAPAADGTVPAIPAAPAAPTAAAPELANAPAIHVVTDVLDIDVSLTGGTLTRADLLAYPVNKVKDSPPVRMLTTDDLNFQVARSGLRAAGGGAEPTHLAAYTAAATEYRLAPGADELRVPLSWTDGQGLVVTKTYVFRRGSYAIDLVYDVTNGTAADWKAASYLQFARHVYSPKRSMFDVESYAYRGPAIYDGKKYRKLDVEDEAGKFNEKFAGGWMAEMQHHFVNAAVPPVTETFDYTLGVDGAHSLLGFIGPLRAVPAGTTAQYAEKLWIGPKLQAQLEKVGPKLELTADYGKLTILAQPLFWLLEQVHKVVRNWGWSIIIVTILLKLLFYKLTETSGRSMAKMRTIGPRMKSIQERYKDDREALAKHMMELYKREKINPLAGCLPILVQIPVFLAFYWVLLESVEMRQAPWLGWIQDLSSRDPYFVLPIIMGGAMFAQFKLNPAPPDPMQAKVFALMPIVMTVMMAWFPSGLLLYWTTNTLLSIAQQWNINRVVAAEAKKRG
ncbi:MAG: membrane protein insertase YidC [Steroidobacteraceae bacterium]